MLAHALSNGLFNVFPILFHVKVCVWAMLSFQKRITETSPYKSDRDLHLTYSKNWENLRLILK